MLVALTINKLSKIHRKPSGDVSPFKNECAKLDANVCGSGMNAELRRFHFRAAPAYAQANGFLAMGHFLRCQPCGHVTQATVPSENGTSGSRPSLAIRPTGRSRSG